MKDTRLVALSIITSVVFGIGIFAIVFIADIVVTGEIIKRNPEFKQVQADIISLQQEVQLLKKLKTVK